MEIKIDRMVYKKNDEKLVIQLNKKKTHRFNEQRGDENYRKIKNFLEQKKELEEKGRNTMKKIHRKQRESAGTKQRIFILVVNTHHQPESDAVYRYHAELIIRMVNIFQITGTLEAMNKKLKKNPSNL